MYPGMPIPPPIGVRMSSDTEQSPEVVTQTIPDTQTSVREKVDAVSIPPSQNIIGTVVDEKYELLEQLGEGGMGHVYRARHVLMGKEFAVKLIHAELAQVNDIVQRFKREARSSSLLNHPNCISVTDFGTHKYHNIRQLYLVMELLEGEDLDYLLHRQKKIPPEKAVEIVRQILKGLGHAHEQGVIHRDLKPENIFLVTGHNGEETVKILDFGIAKMSGGQGDGDKLTKTGVVFGTPKYLSPEQALGDSVDHRSDLYTVGVLLFEMLTGEPPFTGKTVMDVMSAHLTTPPPKLGRYGSYPRGMQRIIQKAMAKKPQHRFKNADHFLKALEEIDYSDNSAPTTVVDHVSDKRLVSKLKAVFSTHRTKLSLALLLLVICAGILGYLSLRTVPAASGKRLSVPARPAAPSIPAPVLEDSNSPKIEQLLEEASDELDAKNFKEAEVLCRKALRADPKNPDTRMMLGHILFESGKLVSGIYQYQQAIDTDARQAENVRFRANMRDGLQWETIRKKSALMLAEYGGPEDMEKLVELASSALTAGDVRRAIRTILERVGKSDRVDWVSSLQADFREQKTCKERIAILGQMVQLKDAAFIPFLEKFEITGKRKNNRNHPNLCFQPNLKYVIKTLSAETVEPPPPPSGETTDQ